MARSEKKEIIENTHVTTAGALKRTGAFFIDLLLLVAGMYLLSLAITPLFSHIYDYETLHLALTREQKSSHLVTLSADILPDNSNIDEVEIVNTRPPAKKLAEETYAFYTIFLHGENEQYTHEWYALNVLKVDEDTSLFTYGESDPLRFGDDVAFDTFVPTGIKYKDDETLVNEEKITYFNNQIYSDAVRLFNARPLTIKMNEYALVNNIALVTIAASLVYFALPIFLRNGKTLGKKIMQLSVTTKYGYKVKELPLAIRFLSFLFINILFNFIIIIVGPFISLTIMVFSPKGQTIHDLIAQTRVVDDTKSAIYTSENEFLVANKLQQIPTPHIGKNSDELNSEDLREGNN